MEIMHINLQYKDTDNLCVQVYAFFLLASRGHTAGLLLMRDIESESSCFPLWGGVTDGFGHGPLSEHHLSLLVHQNHRTGPEVHTTETCCY